MSIEGRINVDCLFHDTDGTNSINVLTLQDSTEYTTGKVISVTATVAAGTSTIPLNQYRDATGNLVTINPNVMVFRASNSGAVFQTDDNGAFTTRFVIRPNQVSVVPINSSLPVQIVSFDTGTYTIILHGT
jgi:hypothetical protein